MNRIESTKTYYTVMPHLLKQFDQMERKHGLRATTQGEYKTWKKEVRQLLGDLIGLPKMTTSDVEVIHLETVMVEHIKRKKILLQVEPEVWMPMYILTPEHLVGEEKMPCILALHGHQGGGKYAVAGRGDIPAIKEKIEFFNYDYGLKLAQMGYVVFCPDARGYGERRETTLQGDEEIKFMRSTCAQLNHMALPLGQTAMGMYVWDLMRLIDFIALNPKWDVSALGCVGFSGGGMQTLWLSALDDRITYSVISGYMYGYKDSLLRLSGNCSCNYVPHLWEHVDMGDIGALIAPRPLLIESGSEDHLNGERGLLNVYEQVAIIEKAYKLFDATSYLVHEVYEGPHRWYGQGIKAFLERQK